MDSIQTDIWKIIDIYFRDNPQALVRHHIDSYNDFLDYDISTIFRETNPLHLDLDYDEIGNRFLSSAKLYFGGKDGKSVFYGKPIIYDENNNNIHFMFPNEARLRNMTYAVPIYCDIEIDITRIFPENTLLGNSEDMPYTYVDSEKYKISVSEEEKTPSKVKEFIANIRSTLSSNNIQQFRMRPIRKFICNLPIMIQSKYCILHGLPRESRFALGECKNDVGGYFIIDGKEKTVVCQEKFGDNMMYVKKVTNDDKYLFSAEIRSVSENVSKPIRTLSMKLVAPSAKYTNQNIVVLIPNVKKPVPLFILFRALGILSDREIISMCLLKDPQDNSVSNTILDWFLPSIHDAAVIQTQQDALEYLSILIKGRTIPRVLHILADYFLPHIGEINFLEKAFFLGHMTNQLLLTALKIEAPTDRDNYKYKRVELVGSLLKDLFREYFLQYKSKIRLLLESKYEYNKEFYNDISSLIDITHISVFENKNNMVQDGIKKAFKGNWGAVEHTKRIGVVQDLNRLSNNGTMSHLRKTNLPLDPSVKLVGPRILHSSQWGIIDPIDTPDGGNIGIHKYLALMTYITRNHSRETIISWIRKHHKDVVFLADAYPIQLGKMTKIIVNGFWLGSISEPISMVHKMKECRRHALIPISTSITFDIAKNTIFIYTDGGRLSRPIFYCDEMNSSTFAFENNTFSSLIQKSSWQSIITGFHEKKDATFDPMQEKLYEWNDLYSVTADKIREKKAILEYVDSSEAENTLIALNTIEIREKNHMKYTHCELHESTLYGVMCNQIDYLEHNPVTRNSFSCGQSKQACSLYHTNYTFRMDKTAVVLNSGQIPLIKSRYLKYLNHEENPYGENAIVAIMCFTGYNVEDAILVNEGALKRGLFRTTYYSTCESHEEKESRQNQIFLRSFHNIEDAISENSIIGIKPGYDYSQLDVNGLIQEGTVVDDKTVLIGISSSMSNDPYKRDESKTPKKGQVGTVDKAFLTEGEEGQRIAKVRIREERIPAMGDKMASRAGQKGTIGMIIAEEDMPFTKDGIRPDLIINPHALPSRMTIGQMVECISGKACANYGAFGDCTAFLNLGQNMVGFFGQLLTKMGFHSSGNEIMYDGMSGSQMESEIFMGPTYYMRLKHMVKDKINYRARGPNTNLTRQPVSGRANDGGLRIGEMERDAVLSHGTAAFLNESMMERGDLYHMAICNKTGMIAVYNPSKNILFSPMADGPIQYTGSLSSENIENVQQIHMLSKFGRDFSVVAVPYAFKLFMQELMAMNVRMCIITEENISQIENMGFSNSLDVLLSQKGALPKTVIDITRNNIENPKMKTISWNYSIPVPRTPIKYEPITPESELNTPIKFEARTPESESNTPESENKLETPEGLPPPSSYMPNLSKYLPKNNSLEKPEPELKGGMMVHYHGDKDPSRLWEIEHVGGNFCTIQTKNTEGLPIEETVQVVDKNELYVPRDDFIYSQNVPVITEAMPIPQIPPSYLPGNPYAENTPSIIIAPKFYNNSTDNSQDTNPNTNVPLSVPMNMNPSSEIEQTIPNINEGEKTPINFDNLVIVKKN